MLRMYSNEIVYPAVSSPMARHYLGTICPSRSMTVQWGYQCLRRKHRRNVVKANETFIIAANAHRSLRTPPLPLSSHRMSLCEKLLLLVALGRRNLGRKGVARGYLSDIVASDLPLNFHPAAIRPYVRGMKVARPRGKLNRGLLWIGRSLAPCLARANHERR